MKQDALNDAVRESCMDLMPDQISAGDLMMMRAALAYVDSLFVTAIDAVVSSLSKEDRAVVRPAMAEAEEGLDRLRADTYAAHFSGVRDLVSKSNPRAKDKRK